MSTFIQFPNTQPAATCPTEDRNFDLRGFLEALRIDESTTIVEESDGITTFDWQGLKCVVLPIDPTADLSCCRLAMFRTCIGVAPEGENVENMAEWTRLTNRLNAKTFAGRIYVKNWFLVVELEVPAATAGGALLRASLPTWEDLVRDVIAAVRARRLFLE